MQGHACVIHLASNPDIAKAVTQPDIDFWEGSYLTQNVLEAMRLSGAKTLLYASGSGVYGDCADIELQEDYAPMLPISTYGASKLAGEALISSYCHMFQIQGRCFRFGNVVGPRQTHGVGYDFARRLLKKDTQVLKILGDGTQSKSYIHVDDVVSAVLTAHAREKQRFQVYNVATGDYITVREIADLAVEALAMAVKVRYEFSGGDRGWRGDVPIVRLDTSRIRSLGWKCQMNCQNAIRSSLASLIQDIATGKISTEGSL